MVMVEDVDVVEPHARERLVEGSEQVLARAQVTVGARPHVPSRLGGDDEFVAVGAEVFAHVAPEVGLRATRGRAVIIGQVEVGDS